MYFTNNLNDPDALVLLATFGVAEVLVQFSLNMIQITTKKLAIKTTVSKPQLMP